MRFLNLWLQIALEWLLHCRPFDVATCVDRCRFATGCCETHCNGCMNVAWAMFSEEAGARNLVFFRVKWAAADDERYLVCAAGAAGVVSCAEAVAALCAFWQHECCMGYVLGRKPLARNLVFFPCKVAAGCTMKGTSSVRRVRLGSFCASNCSSYVFCNECVVSVCVVLFGS